MMPFFSISNRLFALKEPTQEIITSLSSDFIPNDSFSIEDPSYTISGKSDQLVVVQAETFKDDSAFLTMLQKEVYLSDSENMLFLGADTSSLNNGVLIKVGPVWSTFNLSEQKIIIQKLQDSVEILGYGDLKVINKDGSLVARKSKTGEGMILFEREPS